MSHCSSTTQDSRVALIVQALDELNRCVAEYPNATTTEDRWGVLLGECDWRRELERLLYETN